MPHANPQPDKALESSPVLLDERSALRRDRLAARESLPPDVHRRLSQTLEAHLAKVLTRCQPRRLGFCWPVRGEFDCRPLVGRLVASGAQACLPRVMAPSEALRFCAWRPDSKMLVDRYGIHYPASGEMLTPDVLLMPVNAFDAAGYRLGYGGGYFDRTLAELAQQSLKPLTIGIGFELARVPSIFPAAHDMPLDAVVTELGLERFSARLTAPVD